MILIGRLGKISVAAANVPGVTVSASARPAILTARNSRKTLLPRNGSLAASRPDMIIDE
jgi:hypothetical protein